MSKKKNKPLKFKTPFRGKIQYSGPEKAGKAKASKIVTPREFADKAARDEQIEREKALERAALIFINWRKGFVAHRKTLEEVVAEVGELKNELELIGSVGIDFVVGNILNPILTDLASKFVFASFAERVVVSCPNQTIKNGSPADCGWGGFAMFHKQQWQQKKAAMNCPQCNGEITQDGEHMMIEAEARKVMADLEKKGKAKK